jgi:ketosteroid isomerase-like protein
VIHNVEELIDKQNILEVLYRYCRAVDRRDWELLKSVYYEDAIDDHGVFSGRGWDFVEFSKSLTATMGPTTHTIGNHLIELEGDVAYCESYLTAYHCDIPNSQGELIDMALGARYQDRFEKRDGEWRIANRRVIFDWNQNLPTSARWEGPMYQAFRPRGRCDATDPSYERLGPPPRTASGVKPA